VKFPMRIFGEVRGFVPAKLKELQQKDLFPFELRNGSLQVDYEGPFVDLEPLLDEIVAALDNHGKGHVDCLDHEEWEVRRYQLGPGSWKCTRINPDHALEGYHHLQ